MGEQAFAVQGSGGLPYWRADSPAGCTAAATTGSAGPTSPAGDPASSVPASHPAAPATARLASSGTQWWKHFWTSAKTCERLFGHQKCRLQLWVICWTGTGNNECSLIVCILCTFYEKYEELTWKCLSPQLPSSKSSFRNRSLYTWVERGWWVDHSTKNKWNWCSGRHIKSSKCVY